jgi:hypothetical protein
VAAFKELKDVAGVAVQEQAGAAGSVPTVNIFLNGDNEPTFSMSANAVERERDDVIDVTPSNPKEDDIGMAPL